jgi:hypothetical protein
MYVNYYDRVEILPEENSTIGILLCTDKNNTVVKFSLPEGNSTILASQYQLYLPSEKELLAALKTEIINSADEAQRYAVYFRPAPVAGCWQRQLAKVLFARG